MIGNETSSINPDEFWHGFNIGANSVAPVPEPGTMLLLASGLVGLAGFRKGFRKN
ncbi:MAG: PEP-CTERM sorting domain-containing protein [Thermodesulfobacteriota bacterium]